jgi:hypothetical protein
MKVRMTDIFCFWAAACTFVACAFAPLEVRHKRDKRGKSSLPFAFPRFSRLFTGCKPALDRSSSWRGVI